MTLRLSSFWVLVIWLIGSLITVPSHARRVPLSTLDAAGIEQLTGYLADTVRSLNGMRTRTSSFLGIKHSTSLIWDTAEIGYPGRHPLMSPMDATTSPTNIAMDLLVLANLAKPDHLADYTQRALKEVESPERAMHAINHILNVLEKIPRYRNSLFYSWYQTTDNTVHDYDVPSIDNFHLALALWTIKEEFSDTGIGKKAAALFDAMDFSDFLIVNPSKQIPVVEINKGFIGGLLTKNPNKNPDPNVPCEPRPLGYCLQDNWSYRNFGSETRSAYSIGAALPELFKAANQQSSQYTSTFIDDAIKLGDADYAPAPDPLIMAMYYGAAFQFELPRELIDEDEFSPTLAQTFDDYTQYGLNKAHAEHLSYAPFFSACAVGGVAKDGIDLSVFSNGTYNGFAGDPTLVDPKNPEFKDPFYISRRDLVFSPHAAFLAAMSKPSEFLMLFKQMETLGTNRHLYQPGLGWLDAIWVKGPKANIGKVVSEQLSLDQGMLALALFKMLATDGMGFSGRALHNYRPTNENLRMVYNDLDDRLKTSATLLAVSRSGITTPVLQNASSKTDNTASLRSVLLNIPPVDGTDPVVPASLSNQPLTTNHIRKPFLRGR